MTQWLPFPKHPRYLVSEEGQIKGPQGKLLSLHLSNRGYLFFRVWQAGGSKNYTVHRTVCLTFNGSPPPDKPCALHREGPKSNCHKDNLYWGSHEQNSVDAMAQQALPQVKLTNGQVEEILRRCRAGEKRKIVAAEFGITQQYVGRLVNGYIRKVPI